MKARRHKHWLQGFTWASLAPVAPSCMLSRSIPSDISQGRQEARPHLQRCAREQARRQA